MASRWLCPFSCQAGWSLGAGTGFLPLSLGGDGSPPLPCMRPWLGLRAARMPGRAQSQRESHCVSYPHVLFPPAHSLPFAVRRLAVLQDHTRPGTLPVTLLSLPAQGLWRAEMMGPTQNWPLLIFFRRVLECPSWKGPGSSASSSPGYTDGGQAHI